ncbi:MAG TPA: hypothetical protein VGL53_01615, partial [Bryobacteraceae bacterium]
MTQKQKFSILRTARGRLPFLSLLLAATAFGQIPSIRIGTTATQAVISYTAPDFNPCTIDIRETSSSNPLVHDVDPSIYPGSNLDTRAGSLTTGRKRVFVAGKRAAEPGLDGRWYSRALQTNTQHVVTISCSSGTVTGTAQFSTMNSPLGATANDPLPVDPNNPGQYAWPTINWTDRTQTIVDPQTGFLVRQLDSPRDSYLQIGSGSFASASNVGGGSAWTTPTSALADDSAAATYTGTSRGWMFLEFGLSFLNSSSHSTLTPSANTFVPTFNAWCSSGDCSTASSDDRSIQYCMTIDGMTCATDMLQHTLTACTSGCTGSSFRFAAMTSPQAMLADWYSSGHYNTSVSAVALSRLSGVVNRTGASVVLLFGDRFNLAWGAGSTISINSVAYSIASVDSDGTLTLAGSPAGTDTNVPYIGSNAGLLIRKLTTGTQQISVQSVSYSYEIGDAPTLEDSGDEDALANCAEVQVAGPGGELGWHCQVSQSIYWIGGTTGTVNRLGRASVPFNGGTPGWGGFCANNDSFWDNADPNSLYCPQNSHNGHVLLLKLTYSGSNTDIGDLTESAGLIACGSAPCWNVTNLTASGSELDTQMAAFHPAWATYKFKAGSIAIFGRAAGANSLMFMVRRDGNNDTMAFIFKYNLNTHQIDGAMPSWAYWPARWAGMHGPLDMNNAQWGDAELHAFTGPLTPGQNDTAGNGPYLSTITSGAISNAGSPCPVRPANSTIAGADWPTGNKCLQITVDGEPGDPSPAFYNNGTISVTGNTVTGNGTQWTILMDQSQMLINGNYYMFSYISSTQGTLATSPGTLSNVAYTLYLEPVNNSKVGHPLYSYLQDAAERDVFCILPQGDFNGCSGLYPLSGAIPNEYVRLILKSGNTWTLQRGWAGTNPTTPFVAQGANAEIVAQPGSCFFDSTYPCAALRVVWDFVNDPYGYNANGNTVVRDQNDQGCCHATFQGVSVDLAYTCPTLDGVSSGCYSVRFATPPKSFTAPIFEVSYNPLFHGLEGVGYTNIVDTHPGHTQFAATDNENGWIAEARPFLGDAYANLTGFSGSPGVQVSGSLYKFTAAQTGRLRPRFLPTMAACGASPLLDISGPSTVITGDISNSYKYCIANAAGECTSGSAAGDVYMNCPQTRLPYCAYQGVGNSDPDTRDMCIADLGAYTMGVNQVGVRQADPDGRFGRRVTKAFSHYHWISPFWNAKMLPDGHWLIAWSMFLNGLRTSALLVKLPPFPAPDGLNRSDYVPVAVTIQPSVPGVDNAIVQFGYGTNYFCTSRQEVCLQGSASQLSYASENPAGVHC